MFTDCLQNSEISFTDYFLKFQERKIVDCILSFSYDAHIIDCLQGSDTI